MLGAGKMECRYERTELNCELNTYVDTVINYLVLINPLTVDLERNCRDTLVILQQCHILMFITNWIGVLVLHLPAWFGHTHLVFEAH